MGAHLALGWVAFLSAGLRGQSDRGTYKSSLDRTVGLGQRSGANCAARLIYGHRSGENQGRRNRFLRSYGVACLREGLRKIGPGGSRVLTFRKNKKMVFEKSAPFAGFRLVIADTLWGFPCCVPFPCGHAVATTPAQRLGVLFALVHPAVSAFPERVVGSACALSFSRIAQRSLALRPAHSRCHQFVTR